MSNGNVARIRVGKNTAGHKAALAKLGYTVTEEDGHLAVEHNGFEDVFEFTAANLAALVKDKKFLSYKTKVTFEDGKVLTAVPAACKMGQWSCLMGKGPSKSAFNGPSMDEVMNLI
jgi:hypothetical protein